MAEDIAAHAPSGIAVRTIAAIGLVIAVTVVCLVAVVRLVMVRWVVPQHAEVVSRGGTIPPQPRLQANPGQDLEAFRAQKELLLSDWRWVDSAHTIARIPIERAMSLYAEEQQSTGPKPEPRP